MARPSSSGGLPPPAFYSQPHESSIGHSNSHAGFAQPPSRAGYDRPASAVGTTETAGGGDRYLQAAQGIQLTREEKQEGYYDPDLLQSRPRNTTAATQAQLQSRPSSPPATVPASSLPYASRTCEEESIDRKASKPQRPSTSQEEKSGKKVRHKSEQTGRYPSRPSKEPRHVHGSRVDRSKRRGGGGGEKPTSNAARRRRKQLAWWQKPKTFIFLIVFLLVVGLAVGLGVGLTAGKKGDERSPGNPGTASTGGGNTIGGAFGVLLVALLAFFTFYRIRHRSSLRDRTTGEKQTFDGATGEEARISFAASSRPASVFSNSSIEEMEKTKDPTHSPDTSLASASPSSYSSPILFCGQAPQNGGFIRGGEGGGFSAHRAQPSISSPASSHPRGGYAAALHRAGGPPMSFSQPGFEGMSRSTGRVVAEPYEEKRY
ncbi:uncharacterized protein JCM6883_000752 [Sporobolomyces salmoneus]|uniref:uncharacterized protein n=1 Tax=Sporobolomyces salmoneus TaxID=183962 RepID=UPI003171B9B4